MKLFHRLPKLYQTIAIGVLSAVVMVSVGLFTNALLPEKDAGSAPNAEAASGLVVTPVNPGRSGSQPEGEVSPEAQAVAPPPPVESVIPSPAGTASKPSSLPSQDAISNGSQPPSENYENYDDQAGQKYNHFAFDENDPSRNDPVGLFIRESYEREEFLDFEAVAKFNQMKAAAASEGVLLMPVSGFRTISRQAELFDAQVEKRGSEAEAAKLSAPPGHSEHHTGYAIDIGDVNAPDTDIKYAFQNTAAYIWLKKNAGYYGFEESFPDGNLQGVSFEPWHWRYIGSSRAQNVFAGKRYAPD